MRPATKASLVAVVGLAVGAALLASSWGEKRSDEPTPTEARIEVEDAEDFQAWSKFLEQGGEIRFVRQPDKTAGESVETAPVEGTLRSYGPVEDAVARDIENSIVKTRIGIERELSELYENYDPGNPDHIRSEFHLARTFVERQVQLRMLRNGNYWTLDPGGQPINTEEIRYVGMATRKSHGRDVDVVFPIRLSDHADYADAMRTEARGKMAAASLMADSFNALPFEERRMLIEIFRGESQLPAEEQATIRKNLFSKLPIGATIANNYTVYVQ